MITYILIGTGIWLGLLFLAYCLSRMARTTPGSALDVDCSFCGADPGKPCKNVYGKVLKVEHITRAAYFAAIKRGGS